MIFCYHSGLSTNKKGEKMKQLKDMFSEYGDIVTVEEVMKMLQIGRVSVYQMLKSGEIRSLRVGKKYVIPKKSVIELFDFQ